MKARGIEKRGESWAWLLMPLLVGTWLVSRAPGASAQDQFVLVDTTFTATAQNTMMSQYPIKPLPGVPQNWRTPVNYANGSIYVRFEILEKPSTRSTFCNVCFENSGTLTCMPYAAPYTAASVVTSTPKLPSFWQYDVYDWTKPVQFVQVVLKDQDTKLVQGDPQFYPTKMRVTVTVVPPGKTYVEDQPTQGGGDAKPDAGTPSATAGRTGTGNAAAGSSGSRAGAGATGATGATGASTKAGTGAAVSAAGRAGAGRPASSAAGGASPVAAPITSGGSQVVAGARGRADDAADAGAMRQGVHDYLDPGSKCAVHAGHVHGDRAHGLLAGAWIAALLGVLRVRRWRRSSTSSDAGHR